MEITDKYIIPHLNRYKDSMCYDSGTIIAEATINGIYKCSIIVSGSVRVVDNNEDRVYKKASDMPKWLIAEFNDARAYNNDNLFIDCNNWFELYINNQKTQKQYSDVIDIDLKKATPDSIWKLFNDMIDYSSHFIG